MAIQRTFINDITTEIHYLTKADVGVLGEPKLENLALIEIKR